MSYVAIITGLSGKEFFLDRAGATTESRKDAKPFRSDHAAVDACDAHLQHVATAYCPAIARQMSYRVEPLAGAA